MEQLDGAVRTRSLIFNALGHFSNDGMNNFVPIIAEILYTTATKHFSLFYVGILTPVFYIASTILSTFVGRGADRGMSPGRLIAIGILFLSAGLFGFYLSFVLLSGPPLIGGVLVSAVVMGFGSSVYHPISGSIMRQTFTSRNRGRAMGVVGAAGTVGSAIYPSLFYFSAVSLGYSDSLLLLVAMGFAASFVIWMGLKAVRLARSSRRNDDDDDDDHGGRPKRARTRDALTRGIIILTIVTAVRSVSTTGVTAFLPTYLATQKGAGDSLIGVTLSSMFAAGIFGQLMFGAMMDRFDKRLVLGVGSIGSAVSTLGYILTSGPVEILFIALFGFFTFSNFPTLLTLASEYAPEGSSSLGNAFVWGYGITGGNVIGPALVTALVVNDPAQLGFAFIVMAGIGLVGGFVTPLMPRPAGFREVILPQK